MSSPTLSRRGQTRLENEVDIPGYSVTSKFYHDALNPEGIISLATAENSLLSEELAEYMNAHCHIVPSHLKYRTSVTNGFVQSTVQALPLYINDYAKPLTPVTPTHTVIGPGLGSIIAQFMWAVCDEGDGVLLTAPFYDDYRRDVIYPARAKVILARVPPEVDSLSLASISYLRTAIQESEQSGTRIRVLLLCNPHNPLARAYPTETVLAYAALAEEFNLHLLVDEVFANQVFASSRVPQPPPFTSILALPVSQPGNAAGVDPARIHVLAGPTKAFGASGIKVGALVSQHNPALVRMLNVGLRATPISAAADALFAHIFLGSVREGAEEVTELAPFARWFLDENIRRMSTAFELVGSWCDFHKLSFIPPSAGVFFIVDFDPIMPTKDSAGASLGIQERLDAAVAAMLRCGVFIKPTTTFADPIVTRFRMTFTLPEKQMRLALRRLEMAFGLSEWPGPQH
ncbi:aspartate aminotransferase like domain-containing protein [Phanerochaete sordida]|uniref:Aspartate aminotransferase like domain-containing protein n=1 Tax=Phanerochaete sordida TaxID=48140 RepID=A0A9P3GBX7_9APHY|nr:aspartate aminotransferase like domain-containing protein [Phanerochaete sordida]